MLRTGSEHLERLRDGRVIFIGNERVEDVTTHPAFRNTARMVARQRPSVHTSCCIESEDFMVHQVHVMDRACKRSFADFEI